MTGNERERLYAAIRYNSTDMGEVGTFIRLKYVFNILDRYDLEERKLPESHSGTTEYDNQSSINQRNQS